MPTEEGRRVLDEKRRLREAQNFRTGVAIGSPAPSQREFTLEQTIGAGLEVEVGSETFEIRPFPMRRLKTMAIAFNSLPTVALAQAMLTESDARDTEKVAQTMSTLLGIEDSDEMITPAYVKALFLGVQANMDDDKLESMIDVVITTLSFWYPDVRDNSEVLKNTVTYPQIVDVARKVFLLNSGLKDRFVEAQP